MGRMKIFQGHRSYQSMQAFSCPPDTHGPMKKTEFHHILQAQGPLVIVWEHPKKHMKLKN
jgi:hypothetical protein